MFSAVIGAAIRHGVARIDDQVDQGNLKLGDVDFHRPCCDGNMDRQPFTATDAAGEDLAKRCKLLGNVGGGRIDVLATREGQELPGQRRAALRRELYRFGSARGSWVVGNPLFQRLDMSAHDHEQVVEVVRNPAGQLAECIHLLRFGQLFLHLLEGGLRFAALGDITRDLGKTGRHTLIVMDGVDHHASPEERTVLAYAPAFRFIPPFFRCGGERPGRQPRRPVPVGIEL